MLSIAVTPNDKPEALGYSEPQQIGEDKKVSGLNTRHDLLAGARTNHLQHSNAHPEHYLGQAMD